MPGNKKYWQQRFDAAEMAAYHHHLDLRPIDDLDDEGLANMLTHVRGVNMLDLNETEITNASITLLTTLEYVNELRLKGCTYIDDDCITDLNKITSLQFLHVKDTGITIDGLLQLTQLKKLGEVLFSADDAEIITDKLLAFAEQHPICRMIIDGKRYEVDIISYLNFVMKEHPPKFRIKIKNKPIINQWSNWIINPSKNFYTSEMEGSHSIKEIEWIEVDPIITGKDGEQKDFSDKIMKILEERSVPAMEAEWILRIFVQETF